MQRRDRPVSLPETAVGSLEQRQARRRSVGVGETKTEHLADRQAAPQRAGRHRPGLSRKTQAEGSVLATSEQRLDTGPGTGAEPQAELCHQMHRDPRRFEVRSGPRPASVRVSGLVEHSGKRLARRGIGNRVDQAHQIPGMREVGDRAGPFPSRRPPQQIVHPPPNPQPWRMTGLGTERGETAQRCPADGEGRVVAVLVLQTAQEKLGAPRFGPLDAKQPKRLQRCHRVGRVRLLNTPLLCAVITVATLRCAPAEDISQRGISIEHCVGRGY